MTQWRLGLFYLYGALPAAASVAARSLRAWTGTPTARFRGSRLENHHEPAISAYLANILTPRRSRGNEQLPPPCVKRLTERSGRTGHPWSRRSPNRLLSTKETDDHDN